ncbi:MAG TPA: hypothetical protein VFX96_14375 [Pyrinomonadaceae bacterium]|nr:hypothetical protein [Pyrinomonadaceae bacterium]
MSNGSDPAIVITGGSIEIDFDEAQLPPENGTKGKFKNANKRIKRIVISGTGIPSYAEDSTKNGKDIVVKIYYNKD